MKARGNGWYARRRGAGSPTIYISAAVAGLTIGMAAMFMSHEPGPAAPTYTWGSVADTPTQAVSATPTTDRPAQHIPDR